MHAFLLSCVASSLDALQWPVKPTTGSVAGVGLVERLRPSWVSVVISNTCADGRSRPSARKFYISHSLHPNDLVYTENLIEFFQGEGIEVETIALTSRGSKPEIDALFE